MAKVPLVLLLVVQTLFSGYEITKRNYVLCFTVILSILGGTMTGTGKD